MTRLLGLDRLGRPLHYFAELVETHRLADIAIHSAARHFFPISLHGIGGESADGRMALPPLPVADDVTTSIENPARMTIGGVAAQVQFAGLTPGLAGLYQVNAIVPEGVTPGAAVVLSIAQAGQLSSLVTMAVR